MAAAKRGQRSTGGIRWLLVAMTFMVTAVSYLDRTNISISAAAIKQEFELSNARLGAIFSAFVLGYAVAQPVAGRIADRFGAYRVIGAGIVWWSVFTAATAWVPPRVGWSFAGLIGVRLLLGLGESVIFPASNRLVAAWIPRRERGLANGIIFAGVGIGAGIAPPLITWIILSHGWRSAFYATALIGIIALGFWVWLVRDRPDAHPWVSSEESAHIRADDPSAATLAPLAWRDIVRNRQVLLLAGSYFTYGYTAYIFFTWFFTYLSKVRGLDLKASAIYAALPFLAMAAAAPLGGWVSDRLATRGGERRGRCWTAAGAMALAATFVALATQVSDARAATLFLAGGAGALYLSQSAFWTLSADLGGRSAGSVSGVMNMLNQIGGFVTASSTPLIADRLGWTASFLVAALLCLGGAGLWLAIDPDRRLTES